MSSMTGPGGAPPREGVSAGARALDWWNRLRDPRSGDPGVLARLRRCRSGLDAASERAAVDLARRLGAFGRTSSEQRIADALDLARVLAHVKKHDPMQHPMRAAGWKSFAGSRKESDAVNDRPRLAEARFKRLLETATGEEKVSAFTRLIALLGQTVNVEDLANDFLYWNHPDHGDRVRERWAFLYYGAYQAMPLDGAQEESLTTTDTEDDT